MSRVSETWRCLPLLIWALAALQIQQATADVRILCPSVKRDFYPGIEPQNSSAPYVLNVTDEDGRSVHEVGFNGPFYGPGFELTYTSEICSSS